MPLQSRENDVMQDSDKCFAQVQVSDISCASLIHQQCNPIIEDRQICQVRFGHSETILGSLWTPIMCCPVASHSGAIECHGDFVFPISNLFKSILLLLCSLWSSWRCDWWYAWLGGLVVLGRLKGPTPDAVVTWEIQSFLVPGYFGVFF